MTDNITPGRHVREVCVKDAERAPVITAGCHTYLS